MTDPTANQDPLEIEKFNQLASRWWDPQGPFHPLHDINPVRTDYIAQRTGLQGSQVLDIGCGGGLLCETLHRLGALVTGIDASERPLQVARMHAAEAGLSIHYQLATAEAMSEQQPGHYDVVSCLELLEHIPSPASTVAACARLVRPGGQVFFSTINRTPLAWASAILGAEYVLGLLPRGTHEYQKLIRPAELARWCREAGLDLQSVDGLYYNPLLKTARISRTPVVNYLLHASRPGSSATADV